MVGAVGFELTTLCSQSRCATRLRYAPKGGNYTRKRPHAAEVHPFGDVTKCPPCIPCNEKRRATKARRFLHHKTRHVQPKRPVM